ncbi:MAG: GatB/YqeY domain-containing protein [Hyphomicrobiaceae bacterium]
MRDKLMEATKAAMKSGNKARLSTLRLISAALKDRDIAARVDEKGQATGRDKIDDGEVLQLLQKMVKQRRESVETYSQAGRQELADKELGEIAVIEEFLPQQMTDNEVERAVAAVITEIGAGGVKDMGRVMGALKERFTGQMDFAKASAVAKARLMS